LFRLGNRQILEIHIYLTVLFKNSTLHHLKNARLRVASQRYVIGAKTQTALAVKRLLNKYSISSLQMCHFLKKSDLLLTHCPKTADGEMPFSELKVMVKWRD